MDSFVHDVLRKFGALSVLSVEERQRLDGVQLTAVTGEPLRIDLRFDVYSGVTLKEINGKWVRQEDKV